MMYCRYIGKRYRYVNSMDDFNKILDIAEDHSNLVYHKPNEISGRDNTANSSYIELGQRYIKLTTRFVKETEVGDKIIYDFTKDKYVTTWMFDMTGEESYKILPSSVYRMAASVYKPKELDPRSGSFFDKISDDGKIWQSAKPILGFNPKFDKTEHEVWCYDLNSAYAAVLMDKIIDTYHCRMYDMVGENEVGFMMDENLTMVRKGEADVVFPLIDSPYKEYVKYWYDVKKKAPKGSKEKAIAKQILVITVGLWQNHNPFLRSYVVNSCNETIQKLLDKYPDQICCWNTDAVYSVVELPEMDLGDDIGQFKLEYHGLFRQVSLNYQKVGLGETTYRGVCKCLFTDHYNILTDPLPVGGMPFKWDKTKFRVEQQAQGVLE